MTTTTAPDWKPPADRRPWDTPRVDDAGCVRDLVRGGGKSGGSADADPLSTSKTGGG